MAPLVEDSPRVYRLTASLSGSVTQDENRIPRKAERQKSRFAFLLHPAGIVGTFYRLLKENLMGNQRKTPLLLLPFALVWSIFSFMLKLTGRLVAAIIGITFMIVGLILTVTFVAAPIGIPLAIFGFLLAVRSIF
jgi:vacuolar-type H+-ATPase subunit I/STV1